MNNKRKDKVGIATIVGQANYGNRLQNYALDSVLRSLGFDTVTFNDPLQVSFSIKHWVKQEVKRIFGLRDGYMLRRFRQFGKWDKRHLRWQDYHRASDCDYVVLGSDQIWNPDFGLCVKRWTFILAHSLNRKNGLPMRPVLGWIKSQKN